jgi:hypothetical protein
MPKILSRTTATIIFVVSALIIVLVFRSARSIESAQSVQNKQSIISTQSAESEKLTKDVKSVRNCNNMQTSIKIIDESGGRNLSSNSVETLGESPFKNYVATVSKHIFAKIGETAQCRGDLQNSLVVELFFVYRPLIAAGIAPFDLETKKSSGNKYLDSPWVKITSSKSPTPHIQGVFVWSERQFLLDQALLSGARASPTKLLLPINEKTFGKFVQDYTDSVLLAASPEAQTAAQSRIVERLPVDILWLFRSAGQSTRGPFSGFVMSALKSTIENLTDKYINLTKILIDHSFASTNTDLRYKNVLDLKDVFAIDKYRVNKLY